MSEIKFEYNGKIYNENDIYYQGTPKFYLGGEKIKILMCTGQRGRGKNTVHLAESVDWFFKNLEKNDDKHKFHYLRRSEKQIETVLAKDGIFAPCLGVKKYRDKFRGFTEEIIQDKLILLKKPNTDEIVHVGYIETLNNVKGIAVDDSDNLIFDEFIEPERRLYKGGMGGINEPTLFGRLDETLFRSRKRWIVMLANEDSPTNPYSECFGIPYGAKKYYIPEKDLLYIFDYSEIFAAYKRTTSVGKLWANTEYGKYSEGENALGELSTELIAEKPPHAEHYCNINICGTHITAWIDKKTLIMYLSDKYSFNPNKIIYTVMSKDMKVNSLFISYQAEFLSVWKRRYGLGMVRFNSQKTANLFAIMIGLTK